MDFDNRFLARDNDINFNVESRFLQKQLPNRKSAYLQQQQRQHQMFPQNQQFQHTQNFQPQYYQQQYYIPQQKTTFQPNHNPVKQPQPRAYSGQQEYSNFLLQDPPAQRPSTIGMKPVSPIKHSNILRSTSPLRNESPVYRQQQRSNWRTGSPVRTSSVSRVPANVTPIKNMNLSNTDFSTPESVDSNRSSIAELHQNIMSNSNNSDTDVSEDDDELAREIKVAEELAKKAEMIAARARQRAMKKKQEQKQKQELLQKVPVDNPTDKVDAKELQLKKIAAKYSLSPKSNPINAFFEDANNEETSIKSLIPNQKPQVRSNSEEFKQKKNRVTREEVSNLINKSEMENSMPVYEKPEISKQELKQIKKEEEQELKKFKKFQELEAKRVRKENERFQREKERLAKKKEKELSKAKKEEAKKEETRKSKIKVNHKDVSATEKITNIEKRVPNVFEKRENSEVNSNNKSQKKKITKKERKEEAERVRHHYEEVQRKEKRAMKEYRKSVSENNRKSVLQAFASNAVITSENTVPFDAAYIPVEKKSDALSKKSLPLDLKTDNMPAELDPNFHSPTDMLVNGEEDSAWEDYESEIEEHYKKKADRKSIKSFMKLLHHQSSFTGHSTNNSHTKVDHIEAIVPPAYCNAANKQSDLSVTSNCTAAGQHNQNRKSVNKFLFFSKKNTSGEDQIKDITPELQACTTGEFDSCFDEDEGDEFTFENSDFTIRINDKQNINGAESTTKKVRTSHNRRSLINVSQGVPVTPYIDYNEMGYLQDIIEVSDKLNDYSSFQKLSTLADIKEDSRSIVSNEQNSMKQETCGSLNTSPLTNCSSVKSPKLILKSNNSTPRNQSISSFNSVSFCDKVYVKRTYSKDLYDRQSDENNTCVSLDADIIDLIKAELNQFKRQEMPVHRQSLQNTHFFEV